MMGDPIEEAAQSALDPPGEGGRDVSDLLVRPGYPVFGDPSELSTLIGRDIPPDILSYFPLFGARMIVAKVRKEDVTAGGIFRPDIVQDLTRGWIVAVGSSLDPWEHMGVGLQRHRLIGAFVNFGAYAGSELVGDEDSPVRGIEKSLYRVMHPSDVWGFGTLDGFLVNPLRTLHVHTGEEVMTFDLAQKETP